MKIVGIYGLFCRPSGKWYVGQSDHIYKRWGYYGRLDCKSQPKLYNALLKYGYESFEKVVIEECDNVDWILDYREMYWIRRLDSIENGYNVRDGGKRSSGWKLSEETKRKIGNCHRNNESFREKMRIVARNRPPMSEESRKKCSIASRKKGPTSEETRKRISDALKRHGPLSESHKESLRKAAKNRPAASLATREKRRMAAINLWQQRRSGLKPIPNFHPSRPLTKVDDTRSAACST